MKYIIKSRMLLILIFFFNSSVGESRDFGNADTLDEKSFFDKACQLYVNSYHPLYFYEGDSFVVARFNIVPDWLNDYLISCAKRRDYSLLKYGCALIFIHNDEFYKKNREDYIIGEGLLLQKNGFIVLLRSAMGMGNVDDDISTENYFFANTGDVCFWIRNNKKKIRDYKYLENLKDKILRERAK